jgi:hypothetical protein
MISVMHHMLWHALGLHLLLLLLLPVVVVIAAGV